MSNEDLPLPPDGITYYNLLGVSKDAPEKDIEKSYRTLVRKYHPDNFDHWAADDITKRIRTARDVLTDPRRRQLYDQKGHESYTETELSSVSDRREWVEYVISFIDVDNPANPSEITSQSDESVIFDISADDTSDGDDNDNQSIFDAVEEDIDDNPVWDEVQQQTDDEETIEENPSYAGEPDIEQIDSNPPPMQNRDDDVTLSHEEQVNQRAEGRSRVRDPEQLESTSKSSKNKTVADESNEEKTNIIDSFKSSLSGINHWISSKLDDDIISRALRRAWLFRIALMVGFLVLFGVVIQSGLLTNQSMFENQTLLTILFENPEIGVLLIIGSSLTAFAIDQFKTEQETTPGQINAQNMSLRGIIIGFILNFVGFLCVVYLLFNDYQLVTLLGGIFTQSVPEDLFLSGSPNVNIVILLVITVFLSAGLLTSLPSVSRFVWYDRYCNGYRILPIWWDYILFLPIVLSVWMFISGSDYLSVSSQVTLPIVNLAPDIMQVYGVYPDGTIATDAIILTMFILPTIVTILILCRHYAEYGIRQIL